MAATNRKEVLDPALLRPGRLDRIVTLKLPDAAGREKILRVHCQQLPGFHEGQGVDPGTVTLSRQDIRIGLEQTIGYYLGRNNH